MADNLLEVLGTYKTTSKVTFFAADNATHNDKAISLLSREISHYTLQQMRLRSASHILNLVCKAILYGVDEECVVETPLSLENSTHTMRLSPRLRTRSIRQTSKQSFLPGVRRALLAGSVTSSATLERTTRGWASLRQNSVNCFLGPTESIEQSSIAVSNGTVPTT